MPGPLGKKKSERRRRNIYPSESVISTAGELHIPQPPLNEDEFWSPNARNFYKSLAESAQALSYEPSDWALAQFIASLITDYDIGTKASASLLSHIMAGMSHLLVSEGARRRVHMEIERGALAVGDDEPLPEDIAAIEEYRRKLQR